MWNPKRTNFAPRSGSVSNNARISLATASIGTIDVGVGAVGVGAVGVGAVGVGAGGPVVYRSI